MSDAAGKPDRAGARSRLCMNIMSENQRELNPTQLSPSRLAYLGDAVWELCVRETLVRQGVRRPSVESLGYVTAKVQARAAARILPALTEEESDVYRRGRNMGHSNLPKSATLAEYCAATGLECLFGWLRLSDRGDRIAELFALAFSEEAGGEGERASDEPGK